MNLKKEKFRDVTVVTVNLSRATLSESEEFKKFVTEEIEGGARKLVIDLSVCEFIDSTFLGALVVSLKKVSVHSGDLKLIGFNPTVRSMFELTRMYRIFEAYTSVDDALKSFGITSK